MKILNMYYESVEQYHFYCDSKILATNHSELVNVCSAYVSSFFIIENKGEKQKFIFVSQPNEQLFISIRI